jgi:hypothetical protein
MGLISRQRGKSFERKIAAAIRKRIPSIAPDVRRSIQSRKAEESDVTGVPGWWIECQDAANPTPVEKLEQAERDSIATQVAGGELCWCVAITHRKRSQTIQASMRLRALTMLTSGRYPESALSEAVVTLDFNDFLSILARDVERQQKGAA